MATNYAGLWGGGVQLPTGSAPNSFKPQDILASYNENHAASRNANQSLLDRTVAGFDRVLANQQADLSGAFNYLRGTNRANVEAIDRRFEESWGQQVNNLIDRGLGNATIQGKMQQGNERAHAGAITENKAKFGTAMYEASAKNALANSGLANQQLQYLMSNTNIGYPNMGAYAQMAAMGANAGLEVAAPQYATQNGQNYAGMVGRPIGGPSPAWAYYGGGGTDAGMPSSGANLFSGWGGSAGGGVVSNGFSGPNSAAVSGWGRTEAGEMFPSYATSEQNFADYSGYGAQREAVY